MKDLNIIYKYNIYKYDLPNLCIIPFSFQESNIVYNNNNDEVNPTDAKTDDKMKIILKFQLHGYFEGTALSYPIEINVPSFNNVININIKTGIRKNSGHGFSASSGIDSQFAGIKSFGCNAKTAIKKKTNNCNVAEIRYVIKFFILWNIQRAIMMPSTIVDKPSSVKIISAAARAASVLPATAIPVYYII